MRYTIRAGVNHPFSERAGDNSRFILPLLVILAGVLFFVQNPYHIRKNVSPLTLGIYTVKTPGSGASGGGDNTGASGSSPNLSGTTAQSGLNPQAGASAAPATAATGSTAGLGGGGTTTSNPQSGTLSATVTTPTISSGSTTLGGGSVSIDPPLPKTTVPGL
jgi:hypothetical protein